ncbi:hypothetical protein PENTCL1PPCAC_8394, partial [Pristionchus entomophagus]
RLRFDCFLLDFRFILMTRCVGMSSFLASQHLILVLSFERLYAAIFPAHFEKNSSKFLSVTIALSSLAGTFAFSMMQFSNNFRLFHGQAIAVALFNTNIPDNQHGCKVLMNMIAISNCISLIVLFIDFYLNFLRKPVGSASLAISYQFSENRRIVLILLPIELTQTLMGLFGTSLFAMFRKVNARPTPIEQQILLEISTIIPTCFPLMLTFWIRRSIARNANRTPNFDLVEDRFESLRKSWN